MLSTALQFFALVKTNSSLLTAGKNYNTQLSEAWNLPNDVVYPVTTMHFTTRGIPITSLRSQFDEITVALWYFTDTGMTDASNFRDALKLLIEQQAGALARAGLLAARYVTIEHTALGRDPQTNKYMAYAEIRIIE